MGKLSIQNRIQNNKNKVLSAIKRIGRKCHRSHKHRTLDIYNIYKDIDRNKLVKLLLFVFKKRDKTKTVK